MSGEMGRDSSLSFQTARVPTRFHKVHGICECRLSDSAPRGAAGKAGLHFHKCTKASDWRPLAPPSTSRVPAACNRGSLSAGAESPALSESWCSDTGRSYFADTLASLEGRREHPAGEPPPRTPRRGRGAAARGRTARPRRSRAPAAPGPGRAPLAVTTGLLHPARGGRLQLALAGSAPRGLRTGVTEADRVRSLRRQRPPQAGHLGPRLSSSPYSTRGGRGVRGQLIPDFLSPQSLAYKKRKPHAPLVLARCAAGTRVLSASLRRRSRAPGRAPLRQGEPCCFWF